MQQIKRCKANSYSNWSFDPIHSQSLVNAPSSLLLFYRHILQCSTSFDTPVLLVQISHWFAFAGELFPMGRWQIGQGVLHKHQNTVCEADSVFWHHALHQSKVSLETHKWRSLFQHMVWCLAMLGLSLCSKLKILLLCKFWPQCLLSLCT